MTNTLTRTRPCPAAPRLRTPFLTLLLIGAVALATAPTGCASSPEPKTKAKPKLDRGAVSQVPDPAPDRPGRRTAPIGGATDPCAERLHALAGPLLLYYAIHRQLPVQIEELREVAGPDPTVAFTCPVSNKPYLYDPRGLPRPGGRPGFIVVSDAEPTHSGLRWAVAIEEPKGPTQPLVTHVVVEPETTFRTLSPGPETTVPPAPAPSSPPTGR